MELGVDQKTIRKYKPFFVPAAVAVVFLVLSFVAGKFFWDNVSRIRTSIRTEMTQRNVLADKLSILQEVNVEVRDSSGRATLALPQSNPSVFILSQLRTFALDNDIVLEDMTFSSRSSSQEIETQQVFVEFSAIGNYLDVYTYIQSLITISPLVNINRIELTGNRDETTAEVALIGYFSELPDKLPPITSRLDGFTDSERSALIFLEDFSVPEIINNTSREVERVDKGKINPFE